MSSEHEITINKHSNDPFKISISFNPESVSIAQICAVKEILKDFYFIFSSKKFESLTLEDFLLEVKCNCNNRKLDSLCRIASKTASLNEVKSFMKNFERVGSWL